MTFEEWWEKEGQKWEPSGNSSVAWMAWEAAILAEREACARVCEAAWSARRGLETGTADECAAAIRAR